MLVLAVVTMYVEDARSMVRTVCGNNEVSDVGVSMHQRSGLSPLLFENFKYSLQ